MPPLESRNVVIAGRRTSMRFERKLWDLIDDVARREEISRSRVAERFIREFGGQGGSRSSAVRVGVLTYYAAAATDVGHATAGHGRRLMALPASPSRQQLSFATPRKIGS
jgi:predicted DNA-binding ribbon-helix-helix protein